LGKIVAASNVGADSSTDAESRVERAAGVETGKKKIVRTAVILNKASVLVND